jgi:hypothetical protein
MTALLLASLLTVNAATTDAAPAPREVGGNPRGILALRGTYFTGVPDMISVSLAARPFPFLELEVGRHWFPFVDSEFLKAGFPFELVDDRTPGGRGWNLHLTPRLGYRLMHPPGTFNLHAHGATADLALDVTYWFIRHLGLTAQLVGGAGAGVIVSGNSFSPAVWPEIRFALGLAF